MILKNYKLKRLFDAIKYKDTIWNILRAQSSTVLITYAQGVHDILCHLQRRVVDNKVWVWDWQAVTYVPEPSHDFSTFAT